jgi:hypothetical protein
MGLFLTDLRVSLFSYGSSSLTSLQRGMVLMWRYRADFVYMVSMNRRRLVSY